MFTMQELLYYYENNVITYESYVYELNKLFNKA